MPSRAVTEAHFDDAELRTLARDFASEKRKEAAAAPASVASVLSAISTARARITAGATDHWQRSQITRLLDDLEALFSVPWATSPKAAIECCLSLFQYVSTHPVAKSFISSRTLKTFARPTKKRFGLLRRSSIGRHEASVLCQALVKARWNLFVSCSPFATLTDTASSARGAGTKIVRLSPTLASRRCHAPLRVQACRS
jgi:hypothetical protein